MDNILKIAMAQIAPVWLDKLATLDKVEQSIIEAANENCELVVFGEGLIPGYPFWLGLTGGAEWNKKINKEIAKAQKRFGDDFDEQQFRKTNPNVLRNASKIESIEKSMNIIN